jgi:murE/murF fusion protein
MKLRDLVKGLEHGKIHGQMSIEIEGVAYNSKQVERNSVFVAMKGLEIDGHNYIEEAIEKGARAVILEDEDRRIRGIPTVVVPNSRKALGTISTAFFGSPSAKLTLIGITGTNGKTTTAYLAESILRGAGFKTGVIGTIDYHFGETVHRATTTTPESYDLQKVLKHMLEEGVSHVVMEVTSHAIHQHRIEGCHFDIGVFTNCTPDHLDYHKTMEHYFESKTSLFTHFLRKSMKPHSLSLINLDDPKGQLLWEKLFQPKMSYGLNGERHIHAKDINASITGLSATAITPQGNFSLRSPLLGEFNLYNILASAGIGLALQVHLEEVRGGIEALSGVPGRVEKIQNEKGFHIFVDYAHTPDALERILRSMEKFKGAGRIITVFGCGGDRDKEKRPLMGAIAGRYSDLAVITSDNPRTEDPAAIIEEIEGGMRTKFIREVDREELSGGLKEGGYIKVLDRREGICLAIKLAKAGDVVIIAGKGHEDYQIIGRERFPFDDRYEIKEALKNVRHENSFSLQDILDSTGGRLIRDAPGKVFGGISIDSRTIKRGELFIALRGVKFDGHQFLQEAMEKGGEGFIIENEASGQTGTITPMGKAVIVVGDTLRALGNIAHSWREKHPIPLIAVAGSNGKTTTKEIIANLLEGSFRILKTWGNRNNLVGLPLTLLDLCPDHDVAVVEMGMNVKGEIERMTEIANPDVGLITNISEAHLEGLGTFEELIKAKGELWDTMQPDGVIVVNQDDVNVMKLAEGYRGKRVTFGLDIPSDVMAREVRIEGAKGVRFTLTVRGEEVEVVSPMMGISSVYNALAGTAVATVFGVQLKEIKQRLEEVKPFSMRMEIVRLANGATIINDAYNANPKSMELALKTLSEVKEANRGIAILGDMLELGQFSGEAHARIGEKVVSFGVDLLFTLGESAEIIAKKAREMGLNKGHVTVSRDHRDLLHRLKKTIRRGDWILVKGSRAMCMEKIVLELMGDQG